MIDGVSMTFDAVSNGLLPYLKSTVNRRECRGGKSPPLEGTRSHLPSPRPAPSNGSVVSDHTKYECASILHSSIPEHKCVYLGHLPYNNRGLAYQTVDHGEIFILVLHELRCERQRLQLRPGPYLSTISKDFLGIDHEGDGKVL